MLQSTHLVSRQVAEGHRDEHLQEESHLWKLMVSRGRDEHQHFHHSVTGRKEVRRLPVHLGQAPRGKLDLSGPLGQSDHYDPQRTINSKDRPCGVGKQKGRKFQAKKPRA